MYEYESYSLFSSFTVTSKVMDAQKITNGRPASNQVRGGDFKELSEEILNSNKKALEWFVGFSEAESMFFISNTGALNFRIKLHSDDRETLSWIQRLLSGLAGRTIGVIVDSSTYHESYYSIDKFKDIVEIIIPIFNKYYLTTSKYLDFSALRCAADKKKVSYLAKRKLNHQELLDILSLKKNMNMKREQFNLLDLPKRPLTCHRLLGFIEGDGSLCLPNLIPTLVIKQHSKNKHFLLEIAEFLSNLPFQPSIGPQADFSIGSKPLPGCKAGVYTSDKTPTSSLYVADILQLFYYILPFLKSLEFISRKAVDFTLWEAAVNLKALGYTTLPEGKQLLLEISKHINNKRYTSNNVGEVIAYNLDQVKLLLSRPAIFDLTSGLSYKYLSDKVKTKKGGYVGYAVNVYDQGLLIKGSPFPSYTKAALSMGNINISTVISKKIDTNKLYKNRFRFESVLVK